MFELKELRDPLFARASTKRFIDEIAHTGSLCLFAGAGVTVDRTGLTWRKMGIELLARTKNPPDVAHAERVSNALGDQRTGSVIVHTYYDKYGKDGWKAQLAHELAKSLYERGEWLGGHLPTAIAELWLEMRRAERHLDILTTNYDEHIEMELRKREKLWSSALRLGSSGGPTGGSVRAKKDRVVYLHGRIAENQKVTEWPVISERDYWNKAASTAKTLTKHFKAKNLLMVGSSLTDPPLLDALLASREDAEDKELRRFAILPRSDFAATNADDVSALILRDCERRLTHLGVEGIYVDHYAQVAQFLSEVRLAMTLSAGEYPTSRARHGERLREWWSAWHAQIDTPAKLRGLQAQHHQELVQGVAQIQKSLGEPGERLRMELWLRWAPSNGHRVLRLWASSFAQFESMDLTREAPLEENSGFACVKAFCNGRVTYDPGASERWRSFVAIPLRSPFDRASLVVGVVTISTMSEHTSNCLSEDNRGKHRNMIAEAMNLGTRLASTAAPEPAPTKA